MVHIKGAFKAIIHPTCTKTLILYSIFLINWASCRLVEELCDLLLQIQDVDQALNAVTIQPIILRFIKARALELLEKLKVTLK